MSQSADVSDQTSFRAGAFIPAVFFLGPVITAVVPRLTPLFLLIITFVLIVAGRLVRRLGARAGEASWDGTNASGIRVPGGLYFGRTDGVSSAARVVLLR